MKVLDTMDENRMKRSESPSLIQPAPVCTPDWNEFKNFENYIKTLETKYFYLGCAVVKPPENWKNELSKYHSMPQDLTFSPMLQEITAIDANSFLVLAKEIPQMKKRKIIEEKSMMNKQLKKTMTLQEYLQYVESCERALSLETMTIGEIEELYWSTIASGFKLYAADLPFSFFPRKLKTWNFNYLSGVHRLVKNSKGEKVEGVHTPYTYVGSFGSTFAYHTEDMDLASINYQLHGAPKIWWTIIRDDGLKFEHAANSILKQKCGYQCENPLRHKIGFFNDSFFEKHQIRRVKIVQHPGDIVITFPFSFHGGFNCGINYNIAVNYALSSWVPYGRYAAQCTCPEDGVHFRLDLNVDKAAKKYMRTRHLAKEEVLDIMGRPDDHEIKKKLEKKRLQVRDKNFEQFNLNLKNTVEKTRLSHSILLQFAKFLAATSYDPKSTKGIAAFKRLHGTRKLGLPPKLTNQALLKRFITQLYPLILGGRDFTEELSASEYKTLEQKIRKCTRSHLKN